MKSYFFRDNSLQNVVRIKVLNVLVTLHQVLSLDYQSEGMAVIAEIWILPIDFLTKPDMHISSCCYEIQSLGNLSQIEL